MASEYKKKIKLMKELDNLKRLEYIRDNNVSFEDIIKDRNNLMPHSWVDTLRKRKYLEKKENEIFKRQRGGKFWRPFTIYFYGDGKNEMINLLEKMFGDELYKKSEKTRSGSSWWNGYEGQEIVLIDNFQKKIKWNTTMNLLNDAKYNVELKYKGFESFVAKYIFLTNDKSPEEACNFIENDWIQFKRKLDYIIEIKGTEIVFYKGDKENFCNMEWDIKYRNGMCDNREIIEKGKMFNGNNIGKYFEKDGKVFYRREFSNHIKNYLRDYLNSKKKYLIISK
jgi:hypothetical protein